MPRLESIDFLPLQKNFNFETTVEREHLNEDLVIRNLPQLYWEDGIPWNEANLYIHSRVCELISSSISILTLLAIAKGLLSYMRFLEESKLDWMSFTNRETGNPLSVYRGYLIEQRNKGHVSSSLTSARMRYVLNFYRWIQEVGIIKSQDNLSRDVEVSLRKNNRYGFNKEVKVRSSTFAIPNRSRRGNVLEDGLQPLSRDERNEVINLAKENTSREMYLMLLLGFYTGMRIGTICDLKIKTLVAASRHHSSPDLFWIKIGPGVVGAPVRTKHDVTGDVIIPKFILDELMLYVKSSRRLKRVARAQLQDKGHVFINKYGSLYYDERSLSHSTVDVEMSRLRKRIELNKSSIFHFKFHQTRATFATNVAEVALANCGDNIGSAIALVRDLLLHKNESTSMRYIKFVQEHKLTAYWADSFTREVIEHAISIKSKK